MHMSFWFSKDLENFLIYGCSTHSVWALLGICVFVASLAFLFEWVKLLQARHKQKELILRAKQLRTICPTVENTSLLPKNHDFNKPLDLSFKNRFRLYTSDVGLWFTLHNLGYLLMLMVMSYNFWIFLAVLFGSAFGYFIFGQGFMKLNLENCQVIRDTYCMASCAKPDTENEGQSTPAMIASSSRMCHNNHTMDTSRNSPDNGYQSSDTEN